MFATAGAKFYIGGAIDDPHRDLTESDFTSQSEAWVQIRHTENLGRSGDASEEITVATIDNPRARRLKGVRSAGTMELVCSFDSTDAGQVALIAAEKTDFDYAFRLVLDDAPAGGTPSERMFIAAVGSAEEGYDTANNSVKLNASLWINSNVVKINADVGGD